MANKWLRSVGLIVSTGSDGLDLSQMRITFRTSAPDADAPPTAVIRVWNLADETSKAIEKEFQTVSLKAGYQSEEAAVIFQGTIKKFRRGRLSATDKFLDIMAADGDAAFNFGVVSGTLSAGASKSDQLDKIFQTAKAQGLEKGTIPDSLGTGGTLPRGKVLFGLVRDRMTDIADSSGMTWHISDGKVHFVPLTGYLPGEAVVLTSRTGLVGVPEATNNGIEVTCLLDPKIKVGTRVKIDNASINTTTIKQQGFPKYTDLDFPANVSNDGTYRVLVVEHEGDTRGTEFYSHLTCLAIDASAGAGSSVKAYG